MKLFDRSFHKTQPIPRIRVELIRLETATIFSILTNTSLLEKKAINWNEYEDINFSLISRLFLNCEFISLSQFIDEDQDMLKNKEELIFDLVNKYKLIVEQTKYYDQKELSRPNDRQYILHVFGKPEIEWIKLLMRFGGASISNIFFGHATLESDWLPIVLKKNAHFLKWEKGGLEPDNIAMVLPDRLPMMSTVDSDLSFLISNKDVDRFYRIINEISMLHNLAIVFEELPKWEIRSY